MIDNGCYYMSYLCVFLVCLIFVKFIGWDWIELLFRICDYELLLFLLLFKIVMFIVFCEKMVILFDGDIVIEKLLFVLGIWLFMIIIEMFLNVLLGWIIIFWFDDKKVVFFMKNFLER